MSGDYFTHNDRQQPILQHLKWTEDGELSEIDKNKILSLLNANERWRTGSPMQG
tara:strand:- start:421 stop:582 length:162 start_codon:yes stop_codon:yes gene_type:complete